MVETKVFYDGSGAESKTLVSMANGGAITPSANVTEIALNYNEGRVALGTWAIPADAVSRANVHLRYSVGQVPVADWTQARSDWAPKRSRR